MKNTGLFLAIILIFTTCKDHVTSDKGIISVSILPQKYLVEKIAGDLYDVNVLVPPGVSPETYELTPNQMKKLSDSKAYFITGHLTFEKMWRSKFEKMKENVRIKDLSEGIELITMEHAHEDHFHYGVDPHIWVSPKSVKIMAENIYQELRGLDPENHEIFSEGYKLLSNEISYADSVLTDLFNRSENRSFLIFHPALGYLARDYDLEQIPVEFEGKSPPPAYLQKVVEIARSKNIRSILIQKEFSTDNALSIAREIKGDIVVIDPLDENWLEQILSIGSTLSSLFNKEK